MLGPNTFKPVQFGRFLLTDRLAVGGMAEIFTAKLVGAMGFEKRLVVKRILPDYAADRNFVHMLATEAKLVCNLEHPNIVQVYELGEVDGRYYIAMEYVDGLDARTLWRTLARRDLRLPIPLALYVASEFLKGLDYAHNAIGPDGQALGVVHRDVSPSNVMVSFRGDVKIGDFGIALVQQESKSRVSTVKGKYGYMTPEQLSGAPVDHRSDVFASGAVLAELLTGRRLFKGKNDYETMRRVIDVNLHVLDEHEPDIPPDVMAVVRRALMRDVEARYQSAAAFQEALASLLHGSAPRIGGKSLAAFVAEHVVPHMAGRERVEESQVTASGAMEPETISHTLTPSAEVTPSAEYEESEPTIPGGPPEFVESWGDGDFVEDEPTGSIQVVDWSRLAPELAHVDGKTIEEAQPRDGGGLAGHVQSQLDRDLAVLSGERAGGAGFRHHGEVEFDFSEDDEPSVKLMTRDEVLRRMEGELDRPRPALDARPASRSAPAPAPKPAPGASHLEGITVSLRLEEADARGGGAAPEFIGTLASHSVTRVLYRLCVAGDTGLLTVSGPGTAGRQAEIQGRIAALQDELGATTDRPGADRRTCQVELESGQSTLVSADRCEEALAAYLVRVGVVSEERLAACIVEHPRLCPVSALVASGELAPLQLSRQLSSFVQWSVLGAFSWGSGSYAFRRGARCTEGFPSTYRGLELIAKGVSYIEEQALDGYLARLAGRKLVVNAVASATVEGLGTLAPCREVHAAFASPHTTAQVIEACAAFDPRRVKQALYLLIESELVKPAQPPSTP